MALPEKDYFYLQDVSARWQVAMPDLRYYAEHGMLTLQTWLSDTIFKMYRHKRTEDGDIAPVQIGVTNLKGYVVVEPDELRKVFRHDRHAVSLFRSPNGTDLLKIYETRKNPTVSVTDLVIAKAERDRFERENGIVVPERIAQLRPAGKTGIMALQTGRPSAMGKVLTLFDQRLARNETAPTLAAEARILHDLTRAAHPDIAIPTVKTITNNLRPIYRARLHA